MWHGPGIVRTRERFLGIRQLLTMPIFFASNAISAINLVAHRLQIISGLSYEVYALGEFMVRKWLSNIGAAADLAALLGAFTGLVLCRV
jgi:hypothetical protein